MPSIPSSDRVRVQRLLLDEGFPWAVECIVGVADGPETRRAEQAQLMVYSLDGQPAPSRSLMPAPARFTVT